MPYDEKLADRIRAVVGKNKAVTEKRMFGGVSWMLNGHMFVGVIKGDLMVRVGAAAHDEVVKELHARIMDFTGRPMRGYVFVALAGLADDAALAKWLERGREFVATLPQKKKAKKTR